MALLGRAALAMWWDIAAPVRAEFEHWHAHEHFPERLGVPGFRRGTRWHDAGGGEGVFVLYELDDAGVLASPAYVARLNAPTPWSTRLMPHHRGMVRTQCRVVASRGSGVARHALTLHWSAPADAEAALEALLAPLVEALPARPGVTGAHLLRHAPPALAPTTEQRIRSLADRAADGALVVCGYDDAVLASLLGDELAPVGLVAHGAADDVAHGLYHLAASATPGDID